MGHILERYGHHFPRKSMLDSPAAAGPSAGPRGWSTSRRLSHERKKRSGVVEAAGIPLRGRENS